MLKNYEQFWISLKNHKNLFKKIGSFEQDILELEVADWTKFKDGEAQDKGSLDFKKFRALSRKLKKLRKKAVLDFESKCQDDKELKKRSLKCWEIFNGKFGDLDLGSLGTLGVGVKDYFKVVGVLKALGSAGSVKFWEDVYKNCK